MIESLPLATLIDRREAEAAKIARARGRFMYGDRVAVSAADREVADVLVKAGLTIWLDAVTAKRHALAKKRADVLHEAADYIETVWPESWREWAADEDGRASAVRACVYALRNLAEADSLQPLTEEVDRG